MDKVNEIESRTSQSLLERDKDRIRMRRFTILEAETCEILSSRKRLSDQTKP